MPISVPGHPDQHRQAGFSLLEVIIVLLIMGIVTGTVGLSVQAAAKGNPLLDDARRLAMLFPAAQAEARKTGRPVIWEYDERGYRFSQPPRDLLLPPALADRAALTRGETGFPQDSVLRARPWSSERPVDVRTQPAQGHMFNGEWVSGPRQIELDDGLNTISLLRTGNGSYQVQP